MKKILSLFFILTLISCNKITHEEFEKILGVQIPQYNVLDRNEESSHDGHSVSVNVKFNEKNAIVFQQNLDKWIKANTIDKNAGWEKENYHYENVGWEKKNKTTYSYYYASDCLIIHAKYDIETREMFFSHGKLCHTVHDKNRDFPPSDYYNESLTVIFIIILIFIILLYFACRFQLLKYQPFKKMNTKQKVFFILKCYLIYHIAFSILLYFYYLFGMKSGIRTATWYYQMEQDISMLLIFINCMPILCASPFLALLSFDLIYRAFRNLFSLLMNKIKR